MKKTFQILIVAALATIVSVGAFAQSSAGGSTGRSKGPTTFTLTINSNVQGSTVFIDGQRMGGGTPLQVDVTAGQHNVQVSADGYSTYQNSVNVSGNVVVNAVLRPVQFSLQVTSNVNGAAVYINGTQRGATPFQIAVNPGNYTVMVSADGYTQWQNTVNISGDSRVNAVLRPMQYTLQVNSNVTGASVQVGGAPNGTTPYQAQVNPGTYVVTVTAPGYLPFTTSVTVAGDQTVMASLVPAQATVRLRIPDSALNPGDRNPWNNITWIIDGNVVRGNVTDTVQLNPGTHRIRITSGAFSVEGTYVLQPGETYYMDLNLTLQLNLRASER